MASRLLRRSGVGCGLVCDAIGWRADVVVQVGVGQHHEEVDVLKSEWPGVKFYGFDPIAEHIKDYDGTLFAYAVTDFMGEGALHVKRHHKDGSSLGKLHGMDGCKYEKVETTTLNWFNKVCDDVLTNARILLWLDCEGSELKALQGGVQLVERVSVINVEMTARPLGEGWPTTCDVHDWLIARGFYAQWTHTIRVSSGQCDTVYVRRELFKPDLCCFPMEIKRYEVSL